MITDLKIGILGGGQLGKMLCLAAADWDLQIYVLDSSEDVSAAPYCTKFIKGNFNNFEEVYHFGKQVDILTIEIEHINTDALLQLEKEGKIVHPSPSKLNIIKDKGLQKQFYQKHKIQTAPFALYESRKQVLQAIQSGVLHFPFVQKSRTGGYDGKGVSVIKNEADLSKILLDACIIEDMMPIVEEIAVLTARNAKGKMAYYAPIGMSFNQDANLVEMLEVPASFRSDKLKQKVIDLAIKTSNAFDIAGLLAIEMFVTQDDVYVNEVAPRPHNSGHHTIDACHTSQFEQHLRGILNLPLGNTNLKEPYAFMINLLGEIGYEGNVKYKGLEDCLAQENVHIHLYGKKTTKPFRKMGHATITGDDRAKAYQKALFILKHLKAISQA